MKKVLIVEDDRLQVFVQKKFLQKSGYEVASVNKSRDAIEAAKQTNFDVIIMDVRILGEFDGINTMKEIRKFSKAAVIYTTGNAELIVRERAKATHPIGFLVKPINLEELEQLIQSA